MKTEEEKKIKKREYMKEYNKISEVKERVKKWQSSYYKKNKKKIRECQKKYTEENRDKKKEYDGYYYQNNTEKIKKRVKEWVRNNPEQKKEYDKLYYTKNYVILNKQTSLWCKNNPERVRLSNKKSRQSPERKKKQNDWMREDRKRPSVKYKNRIRQKTSHCFPLITQGCTRCSNSAECHHHNTEPYEYDKFEFMCNKCHNEITNNYLNKKNLK